MAHEFALTGDQYVSKSGNDANAGTDPNSPDLTIGAAVAAGTGNDIIVGTGVYEENINLASATNFLKGDGTVILKGDGTDTGVTMGAGAGNTITDVILFNYLTPLLGNATQGFRGGGTRFDKGGCIVVGGTVSRCGALFSAGRFEGTRFVNNTVSYLAGLTGNLFTIDKCIFISCTIGDIYDATTESIKNTIFKDCAITITDVATVDRITNCIFQNCTFTINSVAYATMGAAQTALGGFTNCLETDPLFIGDPSKLEFVVQANSPAIGAGVAGVNIGNVKTGKIQNSVSLEWGLSPQAANNTQFDVNDALVLTSGTSSERESKEIDLGRVVNSPIIRLNGLTDFLNNVPDSNNALANPNHLTFEAQWAGTDKIYNGSWEKFRYNEAMRTDGSSKYTGDSGYDWTGQVDLQFRYLKIKTDIRDDYTVA